MASEQFSTPGQCCVPDCEVALLVPEFEGGPLTRLFACKHKLASMSEYFHKLLYGNFKEKNKKEVTIQDVTKIQMVPFIRWLSKYPKSFRLIDSDSLCSLIFVADRFLCPKLEKQILKVLQPHVFLLYFASGGPGGVLGTYRGDSSDEESAMFEFDQWNDDNAGVEKFGVDAKLKLLKVAENHRGTEARVLEACIRLCWDLEIDQVAALHGKVSDGTLAAVYATIGRAKDITLSKVKTKLETIKPMEPGCIKIDKNLFST